MSELHGSSVNPGVPTWAVWRQDDHGNSFLVEANLTQTQADDLQAQLEARGHKQTYWSADALCTGAPKGIT